MKTLPLFDKLATEPAQVAELVAKAAAVDAPRPWPHGVERFRQSVFGLLAKYGAPDLPWPSMDQLEQAFAAGALPANFAAEIIRADGDRFRAECAASDPHYRP